MLKSPAVREFLQDPKNRVIFERERLAGDWVDIVRDCMEELEVSQAELARRAGVSRAAVSKLLRNPTNVKLGTIVSIGLALGMSWNFTLQPADALLAPTTCRAAQTLCSGVESEFREHFSVAEGPAGPAEHDLINLLAA